MLTSFYSVDWIGLVQAVAAVLAILAGFRYVKYQRDADMKAAGKAAGHLARHSLDFVTERLNALVDPERPIEFALRGDRAGEMVQVLRELPVSSLPPTMIEPVAMVRSAVYAVNNRMAEVMKDDAERRVIGATGCIVPGGL